MKNCLEGWKNIKDVQIPYVEKTGFQDNVIIGKYILAKNVENDLFENVNK